MARIVDITDRLDFEENPALVIKGTKLEVNTDAASVLEIVGAADSLSTTAGAVRASNILFGEDGMQKIQDMHLQFKDFLTVIKAAMDIAMDAEGDKGEGETPATT